MDLFPTIPGLSAGDRSRLEEVLGRSREAGFLGPGPIGAQIDHSLALGAVVAAAASATPGQINALDLGSGGGLPGLVLAVVLPSWRWTLLDGSRTRTEALHGYVTSLGLGQRTTVRMARAEDSGRTKERGSFDIVVARSFAAPAPTAECGAPFLRAGGHLVVTEPPGGAPDRWNANGLWSLGLTTVGSTTEPVASQTMQAVELTNDRYPRRVGVPVKRPLW